LLNPRLIVFRKSFAKDGPGFHFFISRFSSCGRKCIPHRLAFRRGIAGDGGVRPDLQAVAKGRDLLHGPRRTRRCLRLGPRGFDAFGLDRSLKFVVIDAIYILLFSRPMRNNLWIFLLDLSFASFVLWLPPASDVRIMRVCLGGWASRCVGGRSSVCACMRARKIVCT